MRLSVHKFLHNLDVPGSLKLARMRGQIASRKSGLAHQKEEVCALDDVEACHDHEPRWFVDQAVDSSERIEIKHQAHSRQAFADGAIKAARWVANAPKGVHGMEEVLGL